MVRLISLALLVLTMGAAPLAAAQGGLSIFQATLLEADQKTPEVSTADVQRMLADGSAVVFDARPPMEYATSHVPGAQNVAQKPGTPTSAYVSDAAEIERRVPDKATPLV